jgi:hypothetical protein
MTLLNACPFHYYSPLSSHRSLTGGTVCTLYHTEAEANLVGEPQVDTQSPAVTVIHCAVLLSTVVFTSPLSCTCLLYSHDTLCTALLHSDVLLCSALRYSSPLCYISLHSALLLTTLRHSCALLCCAPLLYCSASLCCTLVHSAVLLCSTRLLLHPLRPSYTHQAPGVFRLPRRRRRLHLFKLKGALGDSDTGLI